MGEPLATAQVKDLLEDLLAIPDHQGHEDYKGERGDQELERELGIVIVEGQEQSDFVADEPGPDAEDDRIDASELLIIVHDPQPPGDPHHRQSVPEMMEADSLGGDDLEARASEGGETGAEETDHGG